MTAVWVRLRAELRTRWRAWIGLSVLVGLFFAPVLSAFAGARRTSTVYPRFLEKQRAWDVIVVDGSIFAPILWKPDFAALERLPYVESSVRVVYGGYLGMTYVGDVAGKYGSVINKPKVIEGRLPRPDRPDEVAVSVFQPTGGAEPIYRADRHQFASAHVGSKITLHAACNVAPAASECTGTPPTTAHTMTVVGRIVSPFDFRPNESDAMNLVSPAFIAHPPEIPSTSTIFHTDGIAIRFQHPSDLAKLNRDLKTLTRGKAVVPLRAEANARAVTASARLQGMAVGLLAIFAGLTAILLIAQTLARQTVLESGDHPTLHALGMGRTQTFLLGVIRASGIAVIGATLAGLAAWLASGLFPIGVFRLAEPQPGPRFDIVPMVWGPLAIIVIAVVAVAIPAWRSASSVAPSQSPAATGTAGALARAGMSPAGVAGIRLALERGRGRTAVPVLSTITIVALGIAAMVTALIVSSSIAFLLDTPALYGRTWDKVINYLDGRPLDPGVVRAIAAQPEVEAFAVTDVGAPLTIDGRRIGGIMIHNVKGSLYPAILEGRAPARPKEVVLGTKTLRVLGKHVDLAHPETVRIGIEGLEGTVGSIKIVGRAAIPPVGNYARFGEGLVASDIPLDEIIEHGEETPLPSDSIARFRPGSNPAEVIARVAKQFPGINVGDDFARRPSDVVDFGRVKGMPIILSGILGIIGAGSLAHAVVSAIRRRRRDLAILKTIGFVRGQVRRAVAWQSSTLVVLAVALGAPIGIAGGRALWKVIADLVGVVAKPRVPSLTVVFVIAGAVVLANLIAMFPARTAAGTQPGLVLRSE